MVTARQATNKYINMDIKCNTCGILFHKKPSEVSSNNFCTKHCHNVYRKNNISEEHNTIMKFVKSKWISINTRCGKYRDDSNKRNKSYLNIKIEFDYKTFKSFCFDNKNIILTLDNPSIDRIDSTKNYSISNMAIIELSENIRKKSKGNKYLTNSFGVKRGVRKLVNGKFSARIRINNKETHLGVFETENEAYDAFKGEYFKHYNKYPW